MNVGTEMFLEVYGRQWCRLSVYCPDSINQSKLYLSKKSFT